MDIDEIKLKIKLMMDIDEIKLKIERLIVERNRQDSGINCLTPGILHDIHDYMSEEKNLEKLTELYEDWTY